MNLYEAASAAGVRHLVEHLWEEYEAELKGLAAARRAEGLFTLSDEEILARATARHFAAWAGRRLAANRVQETFYSESNVGIRFDDMSVVVLCPPTAGADRAGQPAVAVNSPREQPGHAMGRGAVGI